MAQPSRLAWPRGRAGILGPNTKGVMAVNSSSVPLLADYTFMSPWLYYRSLSFFFFFNVYFRESASERGAARGDAQDLKQGSNS